MRSMTRRGNAEAFIQRKPQASAVAVGVCCGVRLVTYCVMDNHFHALVEVPRREV